MSHTKLNPNRLGDKQQEFMLMFNLLLSFLALLSYRTGRHYHVRGGELQRTRAQAEANAAAGIGIRSSLHVDKLAIDLHLFIDGVYQTETAAYEPLGVFWESIGGAWGGRFTRKDGNHFSNEFRGRR